MEFIIILLLVFAVIILWEIKSELSRTNTFLYEISYRIKGM